jgi:hypothetical protein
MGLCDITEMFWKLYFMYLSPVISDCKYILLVFVGWLAGFYYHTAELSVPCAVGTGSLSRG